MRWWAVTVGWMVVTTIEWKKLLQPAKREWVPLTQYVMQSFRYHGFSGAGAKDTFFYAVLPALAAGVLFNLLAWRAGTINYKELAGMWYNLPKYWLWASIQMTILLRYLYAQVAVICGNHICLRKIATGFLFGAIHFPNPVLTPVCLFGGLGAAEAYFRWRNILMIGLAQAIIAEAILVGIVDKEKLHHFKVGRYDKPAVTRKNY